MYKDIFSYGDSIETTAYLNWRTMRHSSLLNMSVIADGFMKAAILLAQEILNDNDDKKADVIVFPMLFSANHAIELYLKQILWAQYIILDMDEKHKIEGDHDIKLLYDSVSNREDDVLKKYPDGVETKKGFNQLMKNLKTYIDELYPKISLDDGKGNLKTHMEFSRYPFSSKYEDFFYITDSNNVVVDPENFIVRMTEIGKNLDMIAGYYQYLVEIKMEKSVDDVE